ASSAQTVCSSLPATSRSPFPVPLHCPPPDLLSFPTRRSSDLLTEYFEVSLIAERSFELLIKDIMFFNVLTSHIQCMSFFKFSFKDRKSTRLNSSHVSISYAVFCLKKKRFVLCYCI